MNDVVCRKERIQVQKFNWKQFNSNEINNHIEIILAADGLLNLVFFYFLKAMILSYLF